MKITAMTMLAAMAGVMAQAGGAGQAADKRVTVCVESGVGLGVVLRAQQTASKMFAWIGVTIDWRRHCPAQGILISLSDHTPAERLPHALAYALPYEGTHIVIFYDRVHRAVEPDLLPCLLAHVLVHEITHILQGIGRHSGQGVMKANWDGPDHLAMRGKPLAFAPEDIDLIYLGLAGRAAQAIMAVNSTAPTVAAQ